LLVYKAQIFKSIKKISKIISKTSVKKQFEQTTKIKLTFVSAVVMNGKDEK